VDTTQYQEVLAQKLKDDGMSLVFIIYPAHIISTSAMALQALDQRLSHTNSPVMSGPQSAGPISAHTPRLPPPAVASPRPEKVISPSINQKNSLETDDGDIGTVDTDR
jgi:hypothetical protein